MPWNSQGGNQSPWGPPTGGDGAGPQGPGGSRNSGGPNGPWGRPPGGPPGGGSGGSDFEDFFRRGQDRIRRLFRGGPGPALIGTGLALLLLIYWASAGGFYFVPEGSRGLQLVLGAWDGQERRPGLQFNWPRPIGDYEIVNVEDTRNEQLGFATSATGTPGRGNRTSVGSQIDDGLMLTRDQNIIDLDYAVNWRIQPGSLSGPGGAAAFAFNIRNPRETVRAAAESVMREVIGQTDLVPALTEARGRLEQEARAGLQALLNEYQSGVEVTEFLIVKAAPPNAAVIAAFNDVQAARQEQVQRENEGRKYANDILPKAQGDADRIAAEAESYARSVVARATGEAARFRAVLESYRAAPDVTRQRLYLETLEQVLKGARTIVLSGEVGSGAGAGVLPILPLDGGGRTTLPIPPAAGAATVPTAPPQPTPPQP